MRLTIRQYVAFVVAITAAAIGMLYRTSPTPSALAFEDAFVFCGLAATAELLSFLLPRSAAGSIGFIPYYAAAIVVPAWPSVLGVIVVKAVVELWCRRAAIKAILNVAAHGLMESIVILVYTGLGGIAVRDAHALGGLAGVTRQAALPAIAAFFAASITINLIVNGAIALSSRRTLASVLRDNHRPSTVGIDLLGTPLILVFAWVYTSFGAIAAASFWVPILGLRQLHRTNLELEQTNEELLELMVKSIEARDPYTSGHSRRVQQISMVIARAIGLGEREVEQVGRAALLHDVGKIYEKYASVLSKDDKLTPEEWATIQEHPADGANLVSTMTRLRDSVPAIRSHHENWDGTGYPDRLAGDSIPLAARIIRFADTIDAMTSERPYRRPLSEPQVRSEMIRCRGTQFDPTIADRLLASPLWPTLFGPQSSVPQTKSGLPRLRVSRSAS